MSPSRRTDRLLRRRQMGLGLLGALACAATPGWAFIGSGDPSTRIVELAREIVHARVPYRMGGRTLRGFDCSGLVWYCHQQVGITIPRRAEDQSQAAEPVRLEDAQPADLLFFRMRNARRVDHVGIYVGEGRLIHASTVQRAVAFADLDETYFLQRVASAGRLWQGPQSPWAPQPREGVDAPPPGRAWLSA